MFKSQLFKSIVFGTLLVSSAAGASDTVTVTLGGLVDPDLNVSSAPTAAAAALPLNSTGNHVVKVSVITMRSNLTDAHKFTLTADSTGLLTNEADNTKTLSFLVSSALENGTQPAFISFAALPYHAPQSEDAVLSDIRDLYIAYTVPAIPALTAGTYGGEIVLTVTDI